MTAKDAKRGTSTASSPEALIEMLREGYRSRDPALVASAYAENVESTIVNRNNPPSRPMVLRGRAAVEEMIRDICSREMTHDITQASIGEGSMAYRVECRYPDGCRVEAIYLSTLSGGRIVSEFSIDCWDE